MNVFLTSSRDQAAHELNEVLPAGTYLLRVSGDATERSPSILSPKKT